MEADNFPCRLASVNFFLGCVGLTQVTRIFLYRQSAEGQTTGETVKEAAVEMKESAVGAAKEGAEKVKNTTR